MHNTTVVTIAFVAALAAACDRQRSARSSWPGDESSGDEALYGDPEHPVQAGLASWYSDSLAGNATASGAPYDPSALTAAHRTLPFGTRVRVTRTSTNRSVDVVINDRGPFVDRRVIDLSHAAASQLGIVHAGVAAVQIKVLELGHQRYRRRHSRD